MSESRLTRPMMTALRVSPLVREEFGRDGERETGREGDGETG
jgi:hypothetical protein